MARRSQKPKKSEEDGTPEWMSTYGDMITLVLTFFILLYSFSSIDAVKWDKLMRSFSGSPFVAIQSLDPNSIGPQSRVHKDDLEGEETENAVNRQAIDEEDQEETEESEDTNAEEIKERFDELFESIKIHIEEEGLELELNVEMKDGFIVLHAMDSTFFDSGVANIKKEAETVLMDVTDILFEYDDIISVVRIEGHTDNVPIHTSAFEDNWDLSMQRAYSVLKFIRDHSDPPYNHFEKFVIMGHGELKPIADNSTAEGRAQNRRVDFVMESIKED